jgi:hypothetical protein
MKEPECDYCKQLATWCSARSNEAPRQDFVSRFACNAHKDCYPEDEYTWNGWLRVRSEP